MNATEKTPEGGSFRELRSRHLPLFDRKVHRHDRGWPHQDEEEGMESAAARKRWKNVGIFHFRQPDDDEG